MQSIFMPLGLAVLLAQPTCLYAQAYIATQQLQAGVPANFAAPTTPPPLTLALAIALAFEYHPGLAAAQQEVAAAAGQRVQAAARPNPELSYLSEGLQREGRTTTIQVSQTIELGGKRQARLAVAEREGDIAAAEQATFRNDLRADVVSAFFDVLVAQERTELAEATQRLSQRASDATARRVRAGRISPVDETRARVTEAGSRIELSQATNELALAKRRLAATWANAVPVPDQVIAPDPAPRSADHSREYSQGYSQGYSQEHSREQLAASPQLARAQLEVARQQAQIALELSKRTPDLAVTLGTKRDEQLGFRQTVFGVAVPLPLFDRNRGNVESAMRRADKAKEQLKAVRNTLSTQLDEALLRRAGALAELAIIQGEILPGAQSAFDAASKGAELGKFGFLDVIEAQRTLFQAKNQYIRALAQSYRASADIERLTGAQATKTTPEAPPLAPGASQ